MRPSKSILTIVVLLSMALTTGCGGICDCGDTDREVFVEDGKYTANHSQIPGTTYHQAISESTMTIDQEAGVVVIEYVKNGANIVETWAVREKIEIGSAVK